MHLDLRKNIFLEHYLTSQRLFSTVNPSDRPSLTTLSLHLLYFYSPSICYYPTLNHIHYFIISLILTHIVHTLILFKPAYILQSIHSILQLQSAMQQSCYWVKNFQWIPSGKIIEAPASTCLRLNEMHYLFACWVFSLLHSEKHKGSNIFSFLISVSSLHRTVTGT